MAYCRISFPCFLFVLIACIHLVTIVAQPSDVDIEYYEDAEPYVPPKQSVYESMYKRDSDHQKKSVYERLYKPQKTENQQKEPQQDLNDFEFFPRSTDHRIEGTNVLPKHVATYGPVIFISLVIVSLVLITLLHKFPNAFVLKSTSQSNVKPLATPSPNPSPTKASEKKKRKTMLRRLQEIPKQQAQEIIQNDVQELIRTDSGSKEPTEHKENLSNTGSVPLKESIDNNNANDSDSEIMNDAKETVKSKYNTVATMDHKPKRKNLPLFQDDKKKSHRQSKKQPLVVEEKLKPVEEEKSLIVVQPNSNPSSPVKGTPGVPGAEQPDTVEPQPEDSKKASLTPQQPSNNNKGSLSDNPIPPSPRGERDMIFLYNIISSIKTESLSEEQKISFAQLLLQKYAMDYEVEKRQSKQQEFLIKEQNKQKRHEDEIQLKLAVDDEVFQHNRFLLATVILLGTWLFCLTQRYHGLVALILNYWWDFGKYLIDSVGIVEKQDLSNVYWSWVNPFTMFEDMILRTVYLLFALIATTFLAILTLKSPRLGICITAYITLHVCWESLVRVLVASAPLYFVIFQCCSLLTMKYPKISYARNMYKGAITVSTMVMAAWLGYQLVGCDPLNPERMQGSKLCAILDFFL